MNYFDLHCDLIYRMVTESQGICNNNFNIDFSRIKNKDLFIICCAIWIPDEIPDEKISEFFETCKNKFFSECEKNNINIYRNLDKKSKISSGVILTVESSRVIKRDLNLVKYLRDIGVKIITMTWNGRTESGDGVEVENPRGLTEFGKKLVRELEKNKIIIDLSHSSEKLFYDIIEFANRPVILTHSNSKDICSHRRNITKDQFEAIKKQTDGLIGINFYKEFLSNNKNPGFDDIYRHVDYFLSMGGEDIISIGSDFDGCEVIDELKSIELTENLYNYFLTKNYKENILNKIFFDNSYNFCVKYF